MKKVILFVGIILFATSCKNADEKIGTDDLGMFNSVTVMDDKAVVSNENLRLKQPPVKENTATIQRKLIKTGEISFETTELEKTSAKIKDLVKQYHGYMAGDNEYKSYDRITTTIKVRIPAENFDTILAEITKGVKKIDFKNVNISDVTEQFLDVQARLKTKKALENRYLEILKKAKTVREILDVERELGKLRADIESTEGRLKYLQSQVSFSTLNVTFYKKIAADELSFFGKLSKAFKKGFENVKDFSLLLINIWPFIIILFLLFFYIRKRRLRKKNN